MFVLWICFLATAGQTLAVEKRESKCYGDLGCFSTLGEFKILPQDPKQVQTTFNLFTRQNKQTATTIKALDSHSTWTKAISSSHFSSNRQTKVIIHGFMNTIANTWLIDTKNALLQKGDFNVFIVAWGHGAKFPYDQASANVFLVAEQTVRFLNNLHSANHLNYNDVHLIGHSLGAQACGNVGSKINKVGRITGLDPAQPYFDRFPSSRYLDHSDANFVDIIHTDGAEFSGIAGYGWSKQLGHIDFYPNGGSDQPGCSDSPIGSALSNILHGTDISKITGSLSCSHGRSHEYFLESLTSSCQFVGHKCSSWKDYESGKCHGCSGDNCPIMGLDAVKSKARGAFYLSTTQKSPFCGSDIFVEVSIASNVPDTYGRFYVTVNGDRGSSGEVEFSRSNRHYLSNQKEDHVIAVHGNVGNVNSIKVKYHRGSGLAALGTPKDIKINSVLVRTQSNSNTVKFCEHGDVVLNDGDNKTFSHKC